MSDDKTMAQQICPDIVEAFRSGQTPKANRRLRPGGRMRSDKHTWTAGGILNGTPKGKALMSENDFPSMGINTIELTEEVERLLALAREEGDLGAVNWGDLGVVDIEYRLSMLRPQSGPHCTVMIEEASPDCHLPQFLYEHWDRVKFPNVYFECEW